MSRPKPRADTALRTLQDLGLTENEAVLYTLMLSRPRSTVQELSTRTPFPRTMLYYVLGKLEERGLMTTLKDEGRTVFVAEDPEHLYDLLTEREREFAREAESVRELIPELHNRYRLAEARPSVRTFEGLEEYGKALEDSIRSSKGPILAYESLGVGRPARETRDAHDRKRVARKLKKQVLFFESPEALREVKGRKYDDFTEFRSLPMSFGTDVILYDNKLLYTSYAGGYEPTAVLIEDKALYEMQRGIFESLWKKGTDRTLAYIEK